jgi:hypothetical protein
MEKLNSFFSLRKINLKIWQVYLVIFLNFYSCKTKQYNIGNSNLVSHYFENKVTIGFIKFNDFSILIKQKFKDKDSTILDPFLKYQNIGLIFDSSGKVKDLIGSNFTKELETSSLAINTYNLERPMDIKTIDNKLPEKLDFTYYDILPLLKFSAPLKSITDTNKIFILLVPQTVDKNYLKLLKKMNWPEVIQRNHFTLIVIVKE